MRGSEQKRTVVAMRGEKGREGANKLGLLPVD